MGSSLWFSLVLLALPPLGVDLISGLVPLVVVRWLSTVLEQRVQLHTVLIRFGCEFLSQSLARGLGVFLGFLNGFHFSFFKIFFFQFY